MEEETILCPMASPKGSGTIYWEREAGLKKTKFHTEVPGESETKSGLLVTINEPKVRHDIQHINVHNSFHSVRKNT